MRTCRSRRAKASYDAFVIGVILLSLLSTRTVALSSEVPTPKTAKQAVIVGGGPVGLATAISLSNPPHSYDVTILEQASQEQYDPTKAYLYNVNTRGQVWMKESFPSVLKKLQDKGSQGSMSRITIVPADPEQAIPPRKSVGTVDTRKNPDSDSSSSSDEKTSYWVPRHSMICLLEDEIQEQQAARKEQQSSQVGSIDLLKNRKFSNLVPKDDGSLEVSVDDLSSGKTEAYCGALIIGADGFNSAVRSTIRTGLFWACSSCIQSVPVLCGLDSFSRYVCCFLALPLSSKLKYFGTPKVRDCLADETKTTWLQSKAKQFRVKKWISPASGLRMKVIQMPPGFSIPDANGSTLVTENEYTYAIRGLFTGFTNYLSLGLLPVKDPSMIRPANVITRPSHDIWKIDNGPEAKEWFVKAFPRFEWDKYVDDAEWERFAKAAGTTFPNCQYSPGLQISSPDGQSGVVLVGDAVHAFPPDIGQGKSRSLRCVLYKILSICSCSLMSICPNYSSFCCSLYANRNQCRSLRCGSI